jgi:hypothetical protein
MGDQWEPSDSAVFGHLMSERAMHSVCVHSEERVYFEDDILWGHNSLFTLLFLIGGFTWTEGRMGDGDVRT